MKKSAPKKYNEKLTYLLTLGPIVAIVFCVILRAFIQTGPIAKFSMAIVGACAFLGLFTVPYGIYRSVRNHGENKGNVITKGKLKFIPHVQFKSTKKLADIVTGLSIFSVITNTFLLSQILIAGSSLLNQTLLYNYLLMSIMIGFPLSIATLMWIARSYKNLYSWGTYTRTIPFWAVGYFFIPILNIYKPYQILQEIWLQSGGKKVFTKVILFCWLTNIIIGFFAEVPGNLSKTVTPEEAKSIFIGTIISILMWIIIIILFALLIRKITKLQEAKALSHYPIKPKTIDSTSISMKKLNLLEQTILENILEDNKKEYPFLLTHLPYLRVKSREYTGVGMYSNFEYSKPIKDTLVNAPISSSKRLIIKGLDYELSYEINITNGKIHFLEIVTNGDELWDGNFEGFHFESAL